MTTEQIIWTLVINIVSILIGGGLIGLWIDWRRHQREVEQWELQDQQLKIEIPRAELRVNKWQIQDDMAEEEELMVYRNKLQDTVKNLMVVAYFVITNTTRSEIVITNYDAKILQIPDGNERKRFYELDTLNLISTEDIDAIKLRPGVTMDRYLIIYSSFDADKRLDTVPTTLSIEATTSSGATIKQNTTLNVSTRTPDDVELYQGYYHPKKYVEKLRPKNEFVQEPVEEDDDIPF